MTEIIVTLAHPDPIARAAGMSDEQYRGQVRAQNNAAAGEVLARLSAGDFKERNRFDNFAGFTGMVSAQGLHRLLADPAVEFVEPIRILEPHLAQGIPLMNATTVRSTYNGAGLSVAVCDTGIDYTHPRLGGGGFPNAKILGGYDYGDNDTDPMPNTQAHGTCCAGIVAGDLGTVGDYIGGVAYGAKLYALKISSGATGSATSAAMVSAWDWCVTHQNDDPSHPIMVISTSFGGGRYYSTAEGDASSPGMTTAANNAVAAWITVLASSGNDGYCDSMGWPAAISSVISVGAVYDANFGTYLPCVNSASCAAKTADPGCGTGYYSTDATAADKVTSYSNAASFLTLLAPSNACYTLDIAGASGYSSGDYDSTFGGTSAACPYAAGAVACLQSAAKALIGRYLTVAEVRSTLTSTGVSIADAKVAITKPRINLGAAVAGLGPDTTPPTVTATVPANGGTVAAASSNIDVTFSEPVTGADATDMVLTGTAVGAAVKGAPANTGGNTWRFPVSGLVNGTMNISLAPDLGDITDGAGNNLSPRPTTWSYTVTLDTTPPTVTGVVPANGATITTTSSNIDVTFSEVVTGVDATDMVLAGTSAGSAVKGTPTNTTGNTWRFPVTGLATGTLNVSLAPDIHDIQDLGANDLAPLTWSYTVTIDTSAMEDFETAGFLKFPWVRTGSANWAIATDYKHGGAYSAKSGLITNSQTSTLAVTLNCIAGNITFWPRTSSESGWDYLNFYIDGVFTGSWSGETAWVLAAYPVTAGSRTFTWTYIKDGSLSAGSDAVWLDDVSFPLDLVPPTVTARTPAAGATIASSSVGIDVTFSEVVTGVDATDMVLTGTAAGSAVKGAPTDLGGNTWRFPVSGLVTGTLNVSLAPDLHDIQDSAGNDLAPVNWAYTVAIDVSAMEDFETGDFTKFPWVRTGNANWAITTANKHGGTYSAKAGTITNSQSSTLAVTLNCIAGNVTFWPKISSESGWDYLYFYIDGVLTGTWSGEVDWALLTYPVTAGSRTFTWTYGKDGSLSSGSDTAWLDDITFPLAATTAPPSNPGATAIGQTSITWTWTDNSNDETGFKVYDDPGAGPPVTLRATTAASVQLWQHNGLSVNAQYAFQAAATGPGGDTSKTSNFTTWTLAAVPAAPVVANSTMSTLDASIGAGDGNPPSTLYAIQVSPAVGGNVWVQPGGSVGAAAAYQTAAVWGVKTVTGLAALTPYTFSVFAQNGAGVDTLAGPGALGTTLGFPAPVMDPEPPFTPGTSNTVSWSAVPGADSYMVQMDDDPLFASPNDASTWIAGLSFPFAGLSNGITYHYRAKARQLSAPSTTGSWTQTSQANFDTDTKVNVSTTTSPGDVVLSGGTGAEIVGVFANPSFESGLTGWTAASSGANMASDTSTTAYSGMPTLGTTYLRHYTMNNSPVTAGSYSTQRQSITMPSAGELRFDASGYAPAGWLNRIQAEVRVDGTLVWSKTTSGVVTGQSVSLTAGAHTVDFRLQVLTSGTYGSQWVMFDNIRTYSVSGYAASGTITSAAITPSPFRAWSTLAFTRATPANTTLTVDILPAAGTTPIPGYTGVASGADISGITDTTIRLRANLATANTAVTPSLSDWTVNWSATDATYNESAWSAAVSSTQQDLTAPTPVVTGAATLTNTTRTLTIDFGEVVNGFVLGGISVSNGTASNLQPAGPASSYTVDVMGSGAVTVSVSIPGAVVTDIDGNWNNPTAAPFTYPFDNVAPMPVFTGSTTPTNAIRTVTIDFGEVIDNFDLLDLDLINGTASNLQPAGPASVYTVDITGIATGQVDLSIPAGQIHDAAGNLNPLPTPFTYGFDNVNPTGSISINGGALYSTNASVVLALAYADDAGSGLMEMRFSNDELFWSGWEGVADSKAWTLSAGDGLKTVFVQYRDAAGNVSTGTISDTIALDSAPPTAITTLAMPSPTSVDSIVFTVDFSEPVGATFNDATVTVAGTLAGTAVVTGADPNYTVTVTPADPNANGTVGILIPGGVVTDVAGNPFAGDNSALCALYNWPGIAEQPQGAMLYTGDSHTLRMQVAEGGVSTTYQWRHNDGAKAITDGPAAPQWPLTSVSLAAAGDYWCEVTFDGTMYASNGVTVQVQPHISITTPPVGGNAQPGDSHLFSVVAGGGYGTLSYQWKRNGANIDGANGNEYTLANLNTGDSDNYSVEISDTNGDSIESVPVTLTVSTGVPVAGLGGLVLLAGAIAVSALRRKRR